MFGTVLATLKMSACSFVPSAAASSEVRTKPDTRETIVPAAITALEPTTDGSAALGSGSASGSVTVLALPAVLHQTSTDPTEHHHDEEGAEADQHEPDGLPDLAGPQAEGERCAQLGAALGHRGEHHPGDTDRRRPRLEPEHGALARHHLDRLAGRDRDGARRGVRHDADRHRLV